MNFFDEGQKAMGNISHRFTDSFELHKIANKIITNNIKERSYM